MMSVAPTWSEIPFHIKEDIAQLLDYKSRFRLRVCSKSDLNLVDACPIFLEQVELYATPPHALYINNTIEICQNIVDHFFTIYKHKMSTVNTLVLSLDRGMQQAPSALLAKIDALKEPVKIKAKKIFYKSQGLLDQGCLQVLKVLDPQELLSISSPSWLRGDIMNEFIQSYVWKSVKHLFLGQSFCVSNISINHVLHCEKLRLVYSNLLPDDAWNLIKSFITRDNILPGFGFSVTFYNEITEEQLSSKFEIVPKKVPIAHTPAFSSCFHFSTTDIDLIFVLKTRLIRHPHRRRFRYRLEGFICKKAHPNREFGKYHKSLQMEDYKVPN